MAGKSGGGVRVVHLKTGASIHQRKSMNLVEKEKNENNPKNMNHLRGIPILFPYRLQF
jgi:hypothetical protein